MLKSMLARVCFAVAMAVMIVVSVSASHSWGNYHWARTGNPFTLQVGDNVSPAWDAHLNTALSDWSQSSVLNLVRVTGGSSNRNCRPTAGRIEVCNGKYGNNGWLGIAQIWITGGVHITQATTKLNDTYFNTATYNTPAWRQLVMCQEVGHDFGLDHQDEEFGNANMYTCMDYTNDPSTNQHPNNHDYAQLEAIYLSHIDSFNTSSATQLPGSTPPAMGQIDFDTPGQWGRLKGKSKNGRTEVYELDFGQGNLVVTHVFWADPDTDSKKN